MEALSTSGAKRAPYVGDGAATGTGHPLKITGIYLPVVLGEWPASVRQKVSYNLDGWSCRLVNPRSPEWAGQVLIEAKEAGELAGKGESKMYHGGTFRLDDLGIDRKQSSAWQTMANELHKGGRPAKITGSTLEPVKITPADGSRLRFALLLLRGCWAGGHMIWWSRALDKFTF
jgi:hypothetical protein